MENIKELEYPILSAPYDEDSCLSELDRALDYLHNKKDPALIIDGDHGFKPIKSIYYVVSLQLYEHNDSLFEPNSYELFSDLLSYITSKINEIDFKNSRPNPRWFSSNFIPTNNERRIYILGDLLCIINHLIPESMKLRLLILLDKKRLRNFIDLIANDNFVIIGSSFDFQLIKSTIFDINWLSKSADLNKSDWREINSISVLLSSLRKSTERLKIYIYMAIANIADDKEIEELSEIQSSIDTFVGLANTCANDLKNGIEQRTKQQFTDDDDHRVLVFNVLYVLDTNVDATIAITGTLLAIYRLSINPKSKLNVYNKVNFKESLKIFMSLGNEIEKLYALQIIAQLIFDNQVLNDMIKDEEICSIIKQISENSSIQLEKLKTIAKQIIWSIEENKKTNEIKSNENKSQGHIMISYNTSSRDLCLKIKDELEKDNHIVWIDVNEIHGSSLDSMAKAVEGAKAILMCVTEKYRQSLNCQAEAQYSFRLQKTIIPCIMQKGYHNVDGWLGFIIGDKIFVDFSKYSFEDSILRLKKQINLLGNHDDIIKHALKREPVSTAPENNNKSIINTCDHESENDQKIVKIILNGNVNKKTDEFKENSKKIDKWTTQEVENWFKETGLNNSYIFKTLFPCTGELLTQLNQIQLYAPEFFFKSISNETELKMNDLKMAAMFSLNLKKLFE